MFGDVKKVLKNGIERNIGQIEAEMREGRGIYNWNSKDKYEGEFKEDVIEGRGTYTWANGDKYVGNFKKGKKDVGVLLELLI